MVSTGFAVALLTLLVAVATTTAMPAAPGQIVYYQQFQPLYQPYRAYQPQIYHQHPTASVTKYTLRRSSEQGAAFAPGNISLFFTQCCDINATNIVNYLFSDDEPFVLGDGEIAVGSPSADAPDTYADDAANYNPQSQSNDNVEQQPSFQGYPEISNTIATAPSQDAPEQFADAAPAVLPTRAHRPTHARKQSAAAAGIPHTFFPMSFGSTAGGTVAVANSFSTGKGSSASHAVAYGSKQ